jgi:hypothetical protein
MFKAHENNLKPNAWRLMKSKNHPFNDICYSNIWDSEQKANVLEGHF